MALLMVAAMALGQAGDAEGMVPNPSFERVLNGVPAPWQPKVWRGEGETACAETGHTGGRSVTIASAAGGDISWHAEVPVKPYSSYRLSGWIKTDNVALKDGKGALINIHNLQPVQTPALTGTNDWTRVEVVFETGDCDSVDINCLFGGWGLATGTAWYDDIALEILGTADLKPSAVLDAAKTGEPMSKYVYGQFIEHLGRCIYGGIWAEMLEDRKFFHAIGAEESPWQPIGPAERIEMVKEGAFVGEHTPCITVPKDDGSGIAQGGLALIKGKQYEGRIVVAGGEAAAPVAVSLVWGPGPANRQTMYINELPGDFKTVPLRFTAGADADDGRLEIAGLGEGIFRIGTVSLMPADNVNGMRADTLALLKELDAPIYRWPGGNFVSGYDWRDGIGDRDKRPPRKNPAWKGVEHNDFGLDEYMVFCRAIGTEPLIVVNSGAGDLDMALEELEYANGAPNAPMGRRRAENGHREPYNVTWWGVGNEMYGNWQIGHMPLADYVTKHNAFADAMRAASPGIKIVAVGATGEWSETMLANCAGHMDALSEHFYCQESKGLLTHVRQIPDNVRHKAENHRRYHETIPALQGKKIPIALDEWNYWYGPELYGEIGPRYFLKDALGIAAGIHEMSRNSGIFYMANYAQTVNVIGCIKTTKTAAAFDTTGLVLKLYRHQFGVIPMEVSGTPEPLDVAAAWTEDRKIVTIGVVNPARQELNLDLAIAGVTLDETGRVWRITGPDEMAYNEPGKPPQVAISEEPYKGGAQKLAIPPVSVSLYAFPVKP